MHPVLALFDRNAWATARLLEFCDGRPEVTAAADGDVFGTIEATFNHLVGAEPGYTRLLTGSLPVDLREPRPLAQLREPARLLAAGWLKVLDSERDPEPVLPHQRGRDPEVMADWVPLVQTPHHGDDHRTQVGTLLSRHGVEPPDLDGWAYGRTAAADGPAPRGWWDKLLDRFFGHHLWATQRLLEHCRGLSAEQLALTAPGTYGSIGATLDHLVSSDRSYLSRLRGTGRKEPLDAGGPAALLDHFARQREGWLGHLASKPDFETPIEVQPRGQVPAWVIVIQAIHHGNDHRTNAGTVLLRHGLESPEIDAWAYAWELGALRPLAGEAGVPPPAPET
jgi:uncharacterized damage-inducible protein DinB